MDRLDSLFSAVDAGESSRPYSDTVVGPLNKVVCYLYFGYKNTYCLNK
jgi:hypothetical protein